MRKDMVHALIATPTAGGLVKSLYAHTLVKTVLALKDAGWSVDFELFDGCYVSIARNHFANLLLSKPHYTHLIRLKLRWLLTTTYRHMEVGLAAYMAPAGEASVNEAGHTCVVRRILHC